MSWFHRHRFVVVDVQHATLNKGGGEVTLVLKLCRCSKSVVDTVTGLWSRDCFIPARQAESWVAELERELQIGGPS